MSYICLFLWSQINKFLFFKIFPHINKFKSTINSATNSINCKCDDIIAHLHNSSNEQKAFKYAKELQYRELPLHTKQ